MKSILRPTVAAPYKPATITQNGIPIDVELYKKLVGNWDSIREELIQKIDREYDVFDGSIFKRSKFQEYLNREQINWPRLDSGELDLKDDTFKSMSSTFAQLHPLHELRSILSKMRTVKLQVGVDGRNRCLLSPFAASTSRNQPSTNKFAFGPATFLRGLIKPSKGCGIGYVDWSQQEFGVAAALSGDQKMKEAYESGDPYLSFAIQSNSVPVWATKETHKAERELFKSCVLAQQYGMGYQSLATKINKPEIVAKDLIALHHSTYPRYWKWSEAILNEAQFGNRLWTIFGWQISCGDNTRSSQNFPVQAHGAEMMRIATILMVAEGIKVCAPVHDAFLIEAPLDELDATVKRTQQLMAQASRIVLSGFELASDAKVIRYPNRYMDPRGIEVWNTIMELINEPEQKIQH